MQTYVTVRLGCLACRFQMEMLTCACIVPSGTTRLQNVFSAYMNIFLYTVFFFKILLTYFYLLFSFILNAHIAVETAREIVAPRLWA